MTDNAATTPTGVKAPHGATHFEISWADGTTSRLPHAILRGYCPCATCQGHSGAITFIPAANLVLKDLSQVGNYALQLTWGDGHATGLYTFAYLRRLGDLFAAHGESMSSACATLPR